MPWLHEAVPSLRSWACRILGLSEKPYPGKVALASGVARLHHPQPNLQGENFRDLSLVVEGSMPEKNGLSQWRSVKAGIRTLLASESSG